MCASKELYDSRSIFVPTSHTPSQYKLLRSPSYAFEAQGLKACIEQAFNKLLQEDLCILFLARLVCALFDEAAHGRGDAQANKPQMLRQLSNVLDIRALNYVLVRYRSWLHTMLLSQRYILKPCHANRYHDIRYASSSNQCS